LTIKILGLLHTGVRIAPGKDDMIQAKYFYKDLLGLQFDEKRPIIKSIPGFWVNVRKDDPSLQIHLFGADGISPAARSRKEDPTRAHIAFAVKDLEMTKTVLKARGINFWVYENLVGQGSDQVFFEDPFGNMIEFQQLDSESD
tara:strand:- start:52 stop:480 length:429 start_codon:yes stop_codon:yes gene_type:complete